MNLYELIPRKYLPKIEKYLNFEQTQLKLPLRAVVVGSSGGGAKGAKTHAAIRDFILGVNNWRTVTLVLMTPDQPLWNWIRDVFLDLERRLNRSSHGAPITILTEYSSLEELPTVDEFPDLPGQHLLIVDDCLLEAKSELNKVAEYYVRGRHKRVSPVFLAQDFYKVPKLLRSNASLLMFKELKTRDRNLILSEFSLGPSKQELAAMYDACRVRFTSNVFTIDLAAPSPEYTFRCNLTPLDPKLLESTSAGSETAHPLALELGPGAPKRRLRL
jgi:Poxvirus A32 protein